jgi:hypothetical protein
MCFKKELIACKASEQKKKFVAYIESIKRLQINNKEYEFISKNHG